MKKLISHWRSDLPASLVVFLVALPLCLGVGLASTNVKGVEGLPIVFSGIIAGIVGGIVVGFLSGSRVGVSGPAAGLITIILAAIVTLGSYEAFLVAVMLSGIIQIIAGFTGLGIIGNYFPSSVIKGMLAAIGITLILKEIPHAVGYNINFFGDEAFFQLNGQNTFSTIVQAFKKLNPGALIISVISISILIFFDTKWIKKQAFSKLIPGALVVVVAGISLNAIFSFYFSDIYLESNHLVNLPVASSFAEFTSFLHFPDFSGFTNPNLYVIAITIALIGSLETLLSVEASDKLDPQKHNTPTNRELKAQGVGNLISGFFGGLPVTQVIVRSSANINAGGRTQLSTIIHGFLLVATVAFIPTILNLIPLASLAAILIMIGYKLTKMTLFKQLYKLGWDQFIPFVATIIGVLFSDLLIGIGIGIAFASFFVLRNNYRNSFTATKQLHDDRETTVLKLSQDISFLNKAGLINALGKLPKNSLVIIDGSKTRSIDYDVLEFIYEFHNFRAKDMKIECQLINIPPLEAY